ncbi:MAG: hypothetical protein U0168_15170 [Nannocystaceae bacterium]
MPDDSKPTATLLRLCACLAATTFATLPMTAHAGGTRTWDISNHADFDKGDAEGAALESSGRVTVGFTPARGELPGTTAFTCLSTKAGVLVGTADAATIQRVVPGKRAKPGRKAEPAGKDADGGKAKAKSEDEIPPALVIAQVAKLDGVVVSAMVELPGGDVVAATVPGGKLVRIDGKGKVTPFAALEGVEQIWALVIHDGKLLAGTGPKGELWSMTLAGKDPKIVLDVEEKDVLALASVGKDVVVGVAPQAKLYRVSSDLGGELLYDFPGDEVRALALTRTGLVAVINTFADRKLSSLDALTKTLDRTSLVGQPPAGALDGERSIQAAGKVLHVELGSGRDLSRTMEAPWETWLERDRQYFTAALALDDVGTVLVSSSDDAKVYRVRGPRDVATVADLEERQATALCRGPKGEVIAAAAHGAAVYELGAAPAKRARYVTDVLDTSQPASFGTVRLRGDGALTLRARSGPSDEPDKRWSPWREIPLTREAGGWRGNLGALPHRRHLQLEVVLAAPGAELRAIETFYAPENLAPLLTRVDVERPGIDEGDTDPKVTISWKVDARDEDDLVYDVRVRPEGSGDDAWIGLNPEGELVTKREIKWDTSSVPDGVYEVEVTASDEPSNGTRRARTDELVSEPFVVDRQRPAISTPSVSGDVIKAVATDGSGFVHDVSFAIDNGPMRAASPTDGLFDSGSEAFEIALPAELGKGSHRVVLKARDGAGNSATVAILIKR